jgi:N-acyl amino acid synthase of PEP-CTERM/exosortase system
MKNKDYINKKRDWFSMALQNFQQQAFYNSYWARFDVIEAKTEEQRDMAYQLRYDVFVRENNFVDPDKFTLQREMDEFDKHAVHHLMFDRESRKAIGTVRVLLPQAEHPLTSFELQKYTDHPILQIENRAMGFAEISRLCMSRDFRRRPRDGSILPSYHEQEVSDSSLSSKIPFFRRLIPYAPLGLMMAAYKTILEARILDVVTTADPSQFRSLKRLGLSYRVLGPRLQMMGTQQPFIFNLKSAFDVIAIENPESWEVITNRGVLHQMANELAQIQWQDEIFDEMCRDLILNKVI